MQSVWEHLFCLASVIEENSKGIWSKSETNLKHIWNKFKASKNIETNFKK